MRGIFFDEDEANAVAFSLKQEGWSAEVARERYAGEDDDEDHPWAVSTDAPAIVFEMLIDQYDGWLDAGDEPAAPSAPLDLPTAPKRIKRPTESADRNE